MPARKIRVELSDTEGNRYSVSFEGQVTRDKAVRLLDLVELLGGMPGGGNNPTVGGTIPNAGLSKYDKVQGIVHKHFPVVWFSSKEVQSVYEQELKEPISLSTVATYLSRMTAKGIVLKTGTSNNLKYKTASNFPEATIRQKIS
jgi:hypothetical protein